MKWDREVDVLVFGAGAGGMTAALVAAREGQDVMLCEKTAQVGGTTATSGGTIWVPGNTHGKKLPKPDTVEAARRYLDDEVGPEGRELREAFYASGAEALDYLDRNTDVKFKVNDPYPDYHAEQPGGAQGGRALASLAFDGRKLGADFDLVRPPMPEFMVLGGMMVGRDEIKHMIRPWRSWPSFKLATRLVFQHLRDRSHLKRGARMLLGNALVGRLFYSLRQTSASVVVNARLVSLVEEGGRVQGAVVEASGRRQAIRARKAVVLATGGAAASKEWRRKLMGKEIPHTLAFAGATGDGLDAGQAVGGDIGSGHASPFFWMPASVIQWNPAQTATYPHIRDRPKPGLIAVNAAGERFVDEAASYHDFVMAMQRLDPTTKTIPAYLVCDRAFVRDYGLGVVYPVWQRLSRFERLGYLTSAPTLGALAAKIGVDAERLERTVAQHNADAVKGVDRAFGKGSRALGRYNGDPENKPNPCLRPIATPPYYAVAVNPAPIGSSVGLRTNADGQVLDANDRPIEGLYAVGNDMSSIMRGRYPGPGITLGPAIVFAYRAAMHIAHGEQVRDAHPRERDVGAVAG